MARITTAHAIIQYLRRVQGVDICEIKLAMDRVGMADKSDVAIIAFIERYTSIDLDAANKAVSSHQEAVRAGAKAVHVNGVRYEIKGTHVVTVLTHLYNSGRRAFRQHRKPKAWRTKAFREHREDHA